MPARSGLYEFGSGAYNPPMPFLCLIAACVVGTPQTVRLQLKFPKGAVDRITANIRMDESFGKGGQQVRMTVNESVPMLMTVTSSSPKQATVRMTYGALRYSATVNGHAAPQPIDLGRLITGKSITLTFAPDGRVLRIGGLKALMDGATKDSPPQMRQVFQQLVSEDSVRQMWSMMFGGIIPSRPLRVGETWPSKIDFGQRPMAMALNLRMKLVSVSKGIATIGIGGTGVLAMSGMGAAASLKSSQVTIGGTSKFDLGRGWLVDQNMRIKIAGAVVAKGQTAPFTMVETVTTRVQHVR